MQGARWWLCAELRWGRGRGCLRLSRWSDTTAMTDAYERVGLSPSNVHHAGRLWPWVPPPHSRCPRQQLILLCNRFAPPLDRQYVNAPTLLDGPCGGCAASGSGSGSTFGGSQSPFCPRRRRRTQARGQHTMDSHLPANNRVGLPLPDRHGSRHGAE